MKTLKIGDYIQITQKVRLYIDDIDIELDDGEITVFFMCSEIHEEGTGSPTRPYLQSEIEKYLHNA